MDVQAEIGPDLVGTPNFTIGGPGSGGSLNAAGFPVAVGNGRVIFYMAISGGETGETYRLDMEIASGYGVCTFGNRGLVANGAGRHTVETVLGSNHNLTCDYEEIAGEIASITIEKLTPIT